MSEKYKLNGKEGEIRKLYFDEKKSMKEVAEILGVTPSAICLYFRRNGIKARGAHEYIYTKKQRDTCKQLGLKRKGKKCSESAKEKISSKNRGRRKRDDYEFGGHEKKRRDGYICVFVPDHPYSNSEGYVMKHHLVMEKEIGRYIKPGEVIHHINHIRDDNRIENLKLMTSKEHSKLHMTERWKGRKEKC